MTRAPTHFCNVLHVYSCIQLQMGKAARFTAVGVTCLSIVKTHALCFIQGWGCKGVIIDLRDDPGGNVLAGLATARHLLPNDSKFVLANNRDGLAQEVPITGSDASVSSLTQPKVCCAYLRRNLM
jgi:Peptidase family S41